MSSERQKAEKQGTAHSLKSKSKCRGQNSVTQEPTVRGEEEGESQVLLQHLPDSFHNKAKRDISSVSRCWEQQMAVGLAVMGGRWFSVEVPTLMLPKAGILKDSKEVRKPLSQGQKKNLRGPGFFQLHQKPWPSQTSHAQRPTAGTPQTTTIHFGVHKFLSFWVSGRKPFESWSIKSFSLKVSSHSAVPMGQGAQEPGGQVQDGACPSRRGHFQKNRSREPTVPLFSNSSGIPLPRCNCSNTTT